MSGRPGKPRKQSKSSEEPRTIRPLFLLEDEPVRNYADDRLEVRQYVDVITSTILGTPGPFTIGVYAKWGQGKTSVLRMAHQWLIAEQDICPHVVPVFFNAWLYEREQHPIIPLVAVIEKEVDARLQALESLDDKAVAGLKTALRAAHRGARAFLYGFTLKAEGRLKVPFVGEIGVGAEHSAKDAIDHEEELKEVDTPEAQQRWEKWRAGSLYLSAFETLDAIAVAHRAKGDTPEHPIPRIAVFIDDLDRCLPERAFELLEHIKLAFGHAGFIFILGLNNDVIDAHLVREAERRFGADRAHLYERYLDKIVQLPLPLRSHREHIGQLMDGILARLKHPLHPAEHRVFIDMKDLLVLSCHATPRTLVRRVNTLLVDARLRPSENLPDALSDAEDPAPHARFLAVCLVQRTLAELLGLTLRRLRVADALCTAIAERGLDAVFEEFKEQSSRREQPSAGDAARKEAGARESSREFDADAASLLTELRKHTLLDRLFEQAPAKLWLRDRSVRDLLDGFVGKRPEPSPPRAPKTDARPTDEPTGAPESIERWQTTQGQREIIERAIRQCFSYPAEAPLTPSLFARVTELWLGFEPVTDVGLEMLARAETGLTALLTLDLTGTVITDHGLRVLARSDTGLKALTTLWITGVSITDPGLEALAHRDTGLKALTALSLWNTKVTDIGLRSLARGDTGLSELATLGLGRTAISDNGVDALSQPDTGMKRLVTLELARTAITDTALSLLARSDTGLSSLTTLDLRGTRVTNAGLKAIAHSDTGLGALTTLNLAGTVITDEGFEALASPDSGLKTLTTLDLRNTEITEAGLAALSRTDSGLKELTMLDLRATRITDKGLEALLSARPDLNIIH